MRPVTRQDGAAQSPVAFASTVAADLPNEHLACPPLGAVGRGRLEIRCFHKSKSPRVVGVVHAVHLTHRYGCESYPGAPDEVVELICDKCNRAWAVQMRLLRDVVEGQRLKKVGVAQIARGSTALGRP